MEGKLKKTSFGTGDHRSKGPLEYVHSDVWGPTSVASRGGARYLVSFIDDFSRKAWIYLMKTKDQVFEKFKAWRALVEKQSGRELKILRSDNGGEYTSTEFTQYCSAEGIMRHFTTPGDPQSNGVAERLNMTLMEKCRCMRLTAGFSKEFWGETATTVLHLINRLPSSAIGFKIPEEVWTGRTGDYSYMRIFGCPAYALQKEDKLDSRARKAVLLGYPEGVKGYMLLDLETQRTFVSRHVTFDESPMVRPEVVQSKDDSTPDKPSDDSPSHKLHHQPTQDKDARQDEVQPIAEDGVDQQDEEPPEGQNLGLRRTSRTSRAIQRYGEWTYLASSFALDDMQSYALSMEYEEPNIVGQAKNSKEGAEWQLAMEEEMASLYKNDTWDLVKLPTDRKAIGCKWVFKVKESSSEDGSDIRFKARLVAKGFAQRKGMDYNEIFSPVVRHTSIRVLLAIVAAEKYGA